jgi:uncharacterized protein (TIGR03437 family)
MNSLQTRGKPPARPHCGDRPSRLVLAVLFAASVASAQQYTISTIAGIPQVQGFFGDGALANVAQLYKPQRVAVDSKGNYYIADYYTAAVRMVTASTGNITTIAGTGVPGFAGDKDVATGAQISQVHGVAADATGIVYFSDTGNNRIRKVDAKGIITTFAGNGSQGFAGDGADATKATLWFPAGLALDGSGNLYVADFGNSTVRKITSAGAISTIAGTGAWGFTGDGGAANKATLASPTALAVDAAGNIYIGDVGSNSIRKVTTDGNIRTVATNVDPQSLAVDAAGNIYFVDGLNSVVSKILPSGTTLVIAGTPGAVGYTGDGGPAQLAQLDHPAGLAIDTAGNLYLADSNNQIIRLLNPLPFSVGAVTNAASSVQGSVAPGEILTLFGTGIGPATLTSFTVANASIGNIGNQIAGVQVLFDGAPAPLIYVSSNLIAAIAPYYLANFTVANITVSYQGNTTVVTTVPVVSAAPGIFTADSTGSGQAAAVNSDGSLNSAAKPAKTGSFISLYITGDGQTNPAGVDGKLANAAPYPATVGTVKVTVGGLPAVVNYAGATPTSVAGLTQVNAQIPVGTPVGAAVPVTVQVNGVSAQSGVTISVQ